MIAKVILPHNFNINTDCDFLVGVDYGAYQLAKEKIPMDLAIGDFDSVTEEELNLIEDYAKEIVKLPAHKNETDSEAALMYLQKYPEMKVEMHGTFGKRFDHLLNNFHLLGKYKFSLQDDSNKIFKLNVGNHKIFSNYDYLSLFTLENAVINTRGVKYPLTNTSFTMEDTYLSSNEIVDEYATLEILEGSVIVVLSNDK